MSTSLRIRLFAVLAVILCAWLLAAVVNRSDQAQTRENFVAFANDGQRALQDLLLSYVRTLDGAAGLISASQSVTEMDWRRYVDTLDIEEKLPGIMGLGFITLVKDGPGFDIDRDTIQRGLVLPPIHPDTGREERFVIQFIEPLANNRSALGLDIGFEDNRRETALRARETERPQLTPPIRLVQANEAFSGFLLLAPYFAPANDFIAPAVPEDEFRGWVYMPFVGEALFGALNLRQSGIANLTVTDVTDPSKPVEVLRDTDMAAEDAPRYVTSHILSVYGRNWQLEWSSTPAFEVANASISKWIVLGLGLAIAASLYQVMHLIARREARIESEVRRKTKELRAKHEETQSVIDNAVVSIIVLDATQRILSFNSTAHSLFGEDVLRVGRSFNDVIAISGDRGLGAEPVMRAWPKGRPDLVLEVEENEWFTADGALRHTVLVQDISAVEVSSRKLQENEARWNSALAGAQIGVFDINLKTQLSVVSDTWRKLMDVPEGLSDSEAQKTFLSRIHPEDLPVLQAADAACISGQTDRSIAEYRMKFPDGTWRWMKSDAAVAERDENGTAVRLLGAQTDITDLRLAQDALRASRERFELLLEQAPVGMALLDDRGKFQGTNQALCAMTGFTPEAFATSVRFDALIDKAELNQILQAIKMQREQGQSTYQGEHRIFARTGPPFWGLLSISWTVDPETRSNVYIVQINDISEKKNVELMKSQFVATVSHELRTPLTSIKGALGILGGPMLDQMPSGADRLIEIAASNSDRLSALVNDILDLEKISSGAVDFQIEPHCMVDFVKRCVDQNLPIAAQHKVRFAIDVPAAPLYAAVDARRTEQLIANLLSNACKYSDDDTVVHVRVERVGGMALVCVLNEGPPIPDEFKSRIFRPFSQADSSDTRARGGTGLGLNISRQIVERMGGRIGFDSRPGMLTAFWFTVPLASEAAPEAEPEAKPGRNTPAPFGRPKVLHVEDDGDFLDIVRTGLEKNADIVAARTLDEARKAVACEVFDVIVLDWELPDGHGRDLLEEIVNRMPNARIVALSARDNGVQDIRVEREIVKSRSNLDDVVAKVLGVNRKAS